MYPPPGQTPYNYGPKPDNYLVWAILSTLLCCLPFGIVSIIYAAKVDSAWTVGDVAGARANSDKAKNWAIAAIATGLVGVILYTILGAASVASST